VTEKSKPHIAPPRFTPTRNSFCLCGSGLTFKRCCVDRLPGTSELGSRTRKFLKEGNYKQALEACRADVTQYTIWHKSHTEPAVNRGMPKKGTIFEIDVRALADLVGTLFFCYQKAEKSDEFPAVLERLRDNIKDIIWHRKITYFHAFQALIGTEDDEKAAQRELKKLAPLVDDDDVDTRQLYLQLFGDSLSFSQKHEIIDKIITDTKSLSDRLHYKGALSALYLTIGDLTRAATELEEVINEVRALKTHELSFYERFRFAMDLSLLGSIREDNVFIDEAIDIFSTLLKSDNFTVSGRVNLLGLLGETYKYKSEWENAKASYERAINLERTAIHEIFLCECLLQLQQAGNAITIFDKIKREELNEAEDVDYAYVNAALAIDTGDRTRLDNAKLVLKSVRVQGSIFDKRRDAYLIDVQEALSSAPRCFKWVIWRGRRQR
jgi:tetratricopeptide (TPR) repeat protein